jgi:L-fucose isomerase
VKRVTRKNLTGLAANGMIHLINSGSASLDGSGQMSKDGKPAMKPSGHLETSKEMSRCPQYPASQGYFRGGGYSSNFLTKGGMPVTCHA